jgi:hypothetical protein
MTDVNAKIANLCETPEPEPVQSWQELATKATATVEILYGLIEELLIENRRLQAELKKSVDSGASADGEVD